MLTDDGDVQVEILNLTRAERLNNLSGSLGNQIKWKHNNLFVKLDCLGYGNPILQINYYVSI